MIDENKGKDIILIPTLNPNKKIFSYINNLKNSGFTKIIIVNDGSNKIHKPIFQKLATNGCVVLHHLENYGKGRALKSGFTYIQENYPQFSSLIMVDSDGQHAVEDVVKIAELSKKKPETLFLGVRDFNQSGIPAKSLIGNKLASFIFYILYGKQLSDTQTGLRAFGMPLLMFISNIKGDRFEYEMQMLIDSIQADVPLQTVPIQVIYDNNNKGTHFRALHDSIKVMKTMFANFFRFSVSSIISAAIDLGIAWFLLDFLRLFVQVEYLRILAATAIARILSIGVNYLVNRKFVFQRKKANRQSLTRYLLLSAMIILLSATGVYALQKGLSINEKTGKIMMDSLLFFFSYRIQQKWVFKKGGTE